jgi:hypothetical protein
VGSCGLKSSGSGVRSCEQGNEPLGSIKAGELLHLFSLTRIVLHGVSMVSSCVGLISYLASSFVSSVSCRSLLHNTMSCQLSHIITDGSKNVYTL